MTKTIAGGGEWNGVAAQIEAAIGQPIPPVNSAELDDFLSMLRVNHPGYADMLEKARPVPDTEADVGEDDGLLITGKSRLRQARQQATRRMWWRPASFGKLVLNKKRGGPLILATLALLFGAYTISYFAKPKGKTGGLANGPVNQDTEAALDAATNPELNKVKANPNTTEATVPASTVDAATTQSAKDGTLRQTQVAQTPLGNPIDTQSSSPVSEPPPAFNTSPVTQQSDPVVRPQEQAQTPIFVPVPSTPTPRMSASNTGAASRNSFGSSPSSTPLPNSAAREAASTSSRGATPILLSPIPSGSSASDPSVEGFGSARATANGASPAGTFGGEVAPPRTAGVTYQRGGQPVSASVVNAPKTAATPGIAYVRPANTGTAGANAQAPVSQATQGAPSQPNVPTPASVPSPPVTAPAGTFGGEEAPTMPQASIAPSQAAPVSSAPAPGVMYVASNKKDTAKASQVFYAASSKGQSQTQMLANASTGAPTSQKELNVTASSNSAQTPNAPADATSVGVVPARLITVLEAPLGRPVPAVAESSSGVWVGVAQPNAETGRMEVTFNRLIRGNDSFQVNALAYDTSYQLGLAGTVNDRAPAVLQDVFRAALGGLNTYAQGLAQAGTTTIAGNTVVATQSAPALGTVLAGQLGHLFQLPQGNTSVIRTLRVERETAVYIMTGVTSPTAQR